MNNKTSYKIIALIIIFILVSSICVAQYQHDSTDIVEIRIDSLISKMTTNEKIQQLYSGADRNKRLGIPPFEWVDIPFGMSLGGTSYLPGIGLASTWDVNLTNRIGIAIGQELWEAGLNQAYGPCLDIDRDPRNGRSMETGGEDPFLCAQITTQIVKGIQSTPCIATVKHFNCHNHEDDKTTHNTIASRRVLNEPAGLAFRTAVQQGSTMGVMSDYRVVDGEYCAENYTLLSTILRQQWGFPFYVISNCGDCTSHGVTTNSEQAIKAGSDCCFGYAYEKDLPGLVSGGQVSDSVLNLAVRRVLRTKIFSGMLDYQSIGDPNNVNSTEHQQLSLEAGRESLVLLKNQNHILPLSKSIASIALIGPNIDVCVGGNDPSYSVSARQGLQNKIDLSKIHYAQGCAINSTDISGFAAAQAAARTADVVIYLGGLDPTQDGEFRDRLSGSTNLPGVQQQLINTLATVNPNVVVVVYSSAICSLDQSFDSIKGLIQAFYPGQASGNALADILFGDCNPSGKLPVTMPKNDAQLPPWSDDINQSDGGGYRWFDKMGYIPQYAFGFGLSYTTFSYSNIIVSPASVAPGEVVTVQADVTNTGNVAGDEIAELYLTKPNSSIPMDVKELKGFSRISLSPGQTSTVTFKLTADEMYYYDETSDTYQVESGTYTVRVGGSSDSLPLVKTFDVTNAARKPDLLVTNIRTVPAYPRSGEEIVFYATVKNQGSAPLPAGAPWKLLFKVNGQQVSWSDETKNLIPTAGMVFICGTTGPSGNNTWVAGLPGSYTVEAVVDPDNTVDECVEDNNSVSRTIQVDQKHFKNIALNKPVSASYNTQSASSVVDGDFLTAWYSKNLDDNQWIRVDLGDVYSVDSVLLVWDFAYYGKAYKVQVSLDTTNWQDVFSTTSGYSGIELISFKPISVRYVRMLGIKRNIIRYCLHEFEIFSNQTTGIPGKEKGITPQHFSLNQNYPNPFNPVTTISFSLPSKSFVSLEVFDLLGREVATIVSEEMSAGAYSRQWNAVNMPSGIYFYRLQAGLFTQTKKLVLLR